MKNNKMKWCKKIKQSKINLSKIISYKIIYMYVKTNTVKNLNKITK